MYRVAEQTYANRRQSDTEGNCVKMLLKAPPEKPFNPKIDTTRQIAETIDFSLSGVDALQGEGLRCVFGAIFRRIWYNFWSGVDLAAETLTG
ncbi:MAG: hypothetical protein F6K47_42350 [Symploca sp. SIO2E6]|nr:hypothetical protein [Symploca sp. SIO2E6]